MLFNFRRRVSALALVAVASLLAACNDSTGAAPQPYPTATPAGLAAAFGPVPAGFAVTVTFPAGQAPAGTTITGTASTTAPATVTPLMTRRQTKDIPTSHDTLLYICLTSSASFTGTPTVGVTVASSISSGPFYLAEQTGATWNTSYAGPYNEVGTTVTFDPTGPAPAVSLIAATPECFGLVVASPTAPTATPSASPTPTAAPSGAPTATPTAVPSGVPTATPSAVPSGVPTATPTAIPTGVPTPQPTATPTGVPTPQPTATPTGVPTPQPTATPTAVPTATPTAVPTATPSPTPVPTVTANPNSLDLLGTGAGYAQTTTLSQANSGGAISATSGCAASIVTFSKTTSGDTATFTATGVGQGSCTETFTGVGGATTTVAVSVTTANAGLSGRKRH